MACSAPAHTGPARGSVLEIRRARRQRHQLRAALGFPLLPVSSLKGLLAIPQGGACGCQAVDRRYVVHGSGRPPGRCCPGWQERSRSRHRQSSEDRARRQCRPGAFLDGWPLGPGGRVGIESLPATTRVTTATAVGTQVMTRARYRLMCWSSSPMSISTSGSARHRRSGRRRGEAAATLKCVRHL